MKCITKPKSLVGAARTLIASTTACLLLAVPLRSGDLTSVGPFAARYQEGWESVQLGALNSPIAIIGGAAQVEAQDMYVSGLSPNCLGNLQPAEGVKFVGLNTGADLTIRFAKEVSVFGALFARDKMYPEYGGNPEPVDAPFQITFYDAAGNEVGRDTFDYTRPDGGFDWHGWRSTVGFTTVKVHRWRLAMDDIRAGDPCLNTVLLGSGQLAGQPINAASRTIRVGAGGRIQGSFTVKAINGMGANAIAPVVFTPNWGEPQTSYTCVRDHVPPGANDVPVEVNLTAPAIPGTYYLAVAMAGFCDCAELASGTHACHGADWMHGNPIAKQPDSLFETAAVEGCVTMNVWSKDPPQMAPADIGMTSIKVEVPETATAAVVGLKVWGVVGSKYVIEYRNALDPAEGWKTLTTITLSTTPMIVVDPESSEPDLPRRFYRATRAQ